MKLVVFEGVDKSGKTSIANLLKKKTNFEHLVLDRAFISQTVYAVIYNRKSVAQSCFNLMHKIKNDLIIVYVTASTKVINKRLKESNHEKINVDKEKEVFEYFINRAIVNNIKVIKIDTTDKTEETAANELLNILEEQK